MEPRFQTTLASVLHTKVWSRIAFYWEKSQQQTKPTTKKTLKQTNKTGKKKRPPNQTVSQYSGRPGLGRGHFPHLPMHLTWYISKSLHDPMPSPWGWHNSSMPLATLRAQSVTDSHNHFTGPWARDFQLAAIPHTRRYLTWLLSTVVLMHPGGKSLGTSMMRMPSAQLLPNWAHSSTLGKAFYDAPCPAVRLKDCYSILN